MKRLILSTFFLSLSAMAQNYSLEGAWKLADSNGKPIRFVTTEDEATSLTTERFVEPNGSLAYKIDQQMSFDVSNEPNLTGRVSFFDSRGCSFTDLEVKASFQDSKTLNILMTVPRYKYVVTSNGPMNGYFVPKYCEYQGPTRYGSHPTSYRYICGRRFVIPRKRTECKLLEYIKVPVQLKKNR